MRIETLLNHVEKHKGFVCVNSRLDKSKGRLARINFEYVPRKNSKPICSGCCRPGRTYDHQPTRHLEYIPLWNMPVELEYRPRRVDCENCGVTIELIPWTTGKSPVTRSKMIFLASWARRLSWTEAATLFHSSWAQVWTSVQFVVSFGMANRDMSNINAIGVDEIQYSKGHKYLTLVYQINEGARRLLYVGKDRTQKSLLRFFVNLGKERCANIQYVCSDMWKPYLKVIAKKCTSALHILDRFHIVANLNKEVNNVRAQEARQMKNDGYEEILKKTRYCFLKNPENLTPKQSDKLEDVLQYDLRSVRAYQLKEAFQGFWKYKSAHWAGWYLDKWCDRAMRSRLEPIKKFARSMRTHRPLILNWFEAKKQYSSGIVEGLNRKVNLVTRRSYGFRKLNVLETALFHTLGDLPEPPVTHRFS